MTRGILIGIMRIDLEWYQLKSSKAFRFQDGHIVGGPDGGAAYIAPSTPAHIRCTPEHLFPDGFDESLVLDHLYKLKGISPAYHNGLGLPDSFHRIAGVMNGSNPVTHLSKTFFYTGLVVVKADGNSRIRDKEAIYGLISQEVPNLIFGIIQVGFAGIGGITDQEESHGADF
jgi:hypothetical protein